MEALVSADDAAGALALARKQDSLTLPLKIAMAKAHRFEYSTSGDLAQLSSVIDLLGDVVEKGREVVELLGDSLTRLGQSEEAVGVYQGAVDRALIPSVYQRPTTLVSRGVSSAATLVSTVVSSPG